MVSNSRIHAGLQVWCDEWLHVHEWKHAFGSVRAGSLVKATWNFVLMHATWWCICNRTALICPCACACKHFLLRMSHMQSTMTHHCMYHLIQYVSMTSCTGMCIHGAHANSCTGMFPWCAWHDYCMYQYDSMCLWTEHDLNWYVSMYVTWLCLPVCAVHGAYMYQALTHLIIQSEVTRDRA